jgi:hypothetical protein
MSAGTPDTDFGEGISELSSRYANGVGVELLWRQRDNTAVVAVVDYRNDETLVLDVHDTDNALDIFHHPYAYAAHRRVEPLQRARGHNIGIAA